MLLQSAKDGSLAKALVSVPCSVAKGVGSKERGVVTDNP